MDTHILLVEDNDELAFGLQTNFEFEGYRVSVAGRAAEGLRVARSDDVDLVVLDLMLPDRDGFRVLRELRRKRRRLPVLVLSARSEEVDKVRGFRAGADDYVTKPFGLMELIARVEALLRRARISESTARREAAERSADEGPYSFGDVEVDPDRRTVTRGGDPVSLSPKEFDLLRALLRRNGVVASREDLLREVWNHQAPVASRTVDTHVAELRRKLEEDSSDPRYILTVHKVGYRFQP